MFITNNGEKILIGTTRDITEEFEKTQIIEERNVELEKTVKKVLLGSVYIGETVRELLNEQGINQYAIPVELSLKEIEVVRLLANGMSVTQVASYIHRSVKTISTQKTNAMQKLGLKSDSELFHYAQQQGLF